MKFFKRKIIFIPLIILFLVGLGTVFLRLFEPDLFSVMPDLISSEWDSFAKVIKTATFSPKGYFVYQSIPLTQSKDGFEGRLEVLLDNKMENQKNEDIEKLAETIDGNDIYDPKSKWKLAAIRLLDIKGNSKGLFLLENAASSIKERLDLYGDGRPVFQVNELCRTETGGNTDTAIFEVKDGRLVELDLLLSDVYNNAYMTTNRWKIFPARSGKGEDILSFYCTQPDRDKRTLDVIYTRYYFDGKKWIRKNKDAEVPGDWESYSYQYSFANESDYP